MKPLPIYNQLDKSSVQWNRQDEVLKRYEEYYTKRSFTGDRLIAREKKVLEFLDTLRLPKRAKILELGYGPGNTAYQVVQRGFTIYGVDLSKYFCQLATQRCRQIPGAKVKLEVGDAENLDYKNDFFDVVLGVGFLQYLKDPLRCLQEAHRVLKPNGSIIIAQRNDFSLSNWDNPYHFTKSFVNWSTRRKTLFRFRDTPFLGLALHISKMLATTKWTKKFERHREIGLVRKNVMSYSILSSLLEQTGFRTRKSAAAGFRSRFWYKLFPDFLDRCLQQKSDQREKPFHFGNGIVFLAEKK